MLTLTELILQAIDPTAMKCGFVIKNLRTDETALWNERQRVPSASLIKLPIMAEVLRQAQSGSYSLTRRIRVKQEDKVPFSILTLLETGNDYSLQDLITLMIVQSDNTAANLLIDLAGMEKVNCFLAGLGLSATLLQRKMMDGAARRAGRENFTCAADMARLLELLYREELVDAPSSARMLEIMKQQLDTSMMMLQLPDETVVAHKTGELEQIDHEAGIVYLEGRDYLFVMLVWDAPANRDARLAIGRASKAVYDYFAAQDLCG
jgi:beta-lactamase class A